jgi:hypothetical protein
MSKQQETEARPMVSVDAEALQQVLNALIGPGHHIRELQFTRGLPPLGSLPRNPIDLLIEQYNAAIKEPI